VIAYLRIVVNPRDELAWKRVLKMIPGIGNATANRVYEQIALSERPALVGGQVLNGEPADPESAFSLAHFLRSSNALHASRVRSQPFLAFVKLLELISSQENRDKPAKQIALILENGYEQYLLENYENADARAEDIRGLAMYAQRYDSTETFLSELALLSTERFKEPQPLVGEEVIEGGEEDELLTLTSVHQAKGLEWKAVFIIWAAEGKFPSPKSLREIDAEEEERRLWYVAVTRAKDELYITYPLIMADYNRQAVLQKPSRFVTECPPALFEVWDLEEEVPVLEARAAGATEFLN
jgi:DNA helicase-2/ATP-dependent DNA helicase PcrA